MNTLLFKGIQQPNADAVDVWRLGDSEISTIHHNRIRLSRVPGPLFANEKPASIIRVYPGQVFGRLTYSYLHFCTLCNP